MHKDAEIAHQRAARELAALQRREQQVDYRYSQEFRTVENNEPPKEEVPQAFMAPPAGTKNSNSRGGRGGARGSKRGDGSSDNRGDRGGQ